MANKRKTISKKLRFEIFKRDKFTCQYCGRMSPDVVLEIDHINPVSKGGENDIMNLVTACYDCNRGKRDVLLSDDTTIKKQQAQLKAIADRKEQLEMLLEWRESLNNFDKDCIEAVNDIFLMYTGSGASEFGKKKIKKWIKEFSLNEVLDAVETALDTYYSDTDESWIEAFNKVSGICYIRRLQVKLFIQEWIHNAEDFECLKKVINKAKRWTDFKNLCKALVYGEE